MDDIEKGKKNLGRDLDSLHRSSINALNAFQKGEYDKVEIIANSAEQFAKTSKSIAKNLKELVNNK